MRDYRKRWGIESLFGDCKTRGLNLEDTHITDPTKLDALMGIVALAIARACRCATAVQGWSVIGFCQCSCPASSWGGSRFWVDFFALWVYPKGAGV